MVFAITVIVVTFFCKGIQVHPEAQKPRRTRLFFVFWPSEKFRNTWLFSHIVVSLQRETKL